jgi:methylmalonyl-CoA/ethylmalonyl-CoA epimerase
MIIDHIGIAVKSMEQAIDYWEKTFGYKQMTRIVKNSRQKVWVVFLSKKDSLPIKLISPVDKTSPIYRFAQKGGGMHHLCFACDDLNPELKRLKEEGLRLLTSPEPGEAFQGENIAFLRARNLGNIELIDTEKRCFLDSSENEQGKN